MRGARILAAVLLGMVFLAGCTTAPKPTKTNPEPPRNARATLQAFFDAWQAEDQAAAEELCTPRKQGGTWEFGGLRRIEFGAITEAPEEVAGYLTSGAGSESDVAAEDVAVFSADVTFYYEPGAQGTTENGVPLGWMWILVRDDSGAWRVDDWGY